MKRRDTTTAECRAEYAAIKRLREFRDQVRLLERTILNVDLAFLRNMFDDPHDRHASMSLERLQGILSATSSLLSQLSDDDHQVNERSHVTTATIEHLLRTVPAKVYWWATVWGMTPRGRRFPDVEQLRPPAPCGEAAA